MRDVIAGRNLESYLLEREIALEADRDSRQRFDPLTCQCCGHKRHTERDPDCICDGLDWYQSADGRTECAAHRFERQLKGARKHTFLFWRR